MTEFGVFHKYGEELEKRLRLQSSPVAVRLLEKEADIPEGAERPLRDFGYHILLCQGYAMSRREGRTIAMFKEDMWCFEPIVGYGWAEPPQYFLEGYSRFPMDVKNLEAGRAFLDDFPRLEIGLYRGVVSAPLVTANFEPNLVMLYCNSAQLNLLLLAREYESGHDLKCNLCSHAACVYAVVPVIKSGQCQVTIPCRGDRYFALAAADEVIFVVPTRKLESLLTGLRHVQKYSSKYQQPHMRREPELPESYRKILRMLRGL